MTDIEYRNTLYEIDEILKAMDSSLIEKIPEKIRNIIKNDKSDNYHFSINSLKELDETKILKTTQIYLASLYMNYWCDDDEKQEFIKLMNDNEEKYQEELKKQYNPDKLFKNKNTEVQSVTQEVQIIEYKEENILKKILNKIKRLFKK